MSVDTPWLPATGRHSVSLGSSLSKALQARKNRTGPPKPSKFDKYFYSVRYNHKPSSIDTSKSGHVVRHSENRDFPVTLHQPSKDGKSLEWQGQEANPAEWTCVLVYDAQTQSYVLEKVESSLNMTYVRRTQTDDAAPAPSASDDLAGELEDALRAEESSEEGEIPLRQVVSPKAKPKPKPKPAAKPPPPPPAEAPPAPPKGKNKRLSPPPPASAPVPAPPAPTPRLAKRARPSPPPPKRKPVPQKKAPSPPSPADLMFPVSGGGITLPGALEPPPPAPTPRVASPIALPVSPPAAPTPAIDAAAEDSEEEEWDEVPAVPTPEVPTPEMPTPAQPDFLGLEMEEIDGNDLERELESQMGGGGGGGGDGGGDDMFGDDDEEDDDMVDVFEEEMNKQLDGGGDDGTGAADDGNLDVDPEEDDFLTASMEVAPSNPAQMSMDAGDEDYYSTTTDEDD
ncbi:RNA polymerase II transcription elongation factor-domain-containing protein [Schizophyllum fasciatum]